MRVCERTSPLLKAERRAASVLPGAALLGLLTVGVGCPRQAPTPEARTEIQERPAPREPTPEEVRVQAEAAGDAGVAELIALASEGPDGRRARALRGLGRSGTEEARVYLEAALAGDPAQDEAAHAYGLLGETGSAGPILAALEGAPAGATIALLDALSRVAVATDRTRVMPILSEHLRGDEPMIAAAAGRALGRLGRRSIEGDGPATQAAISGSRRAAVEVRRAATYGLARGAPSTPAVLMALRERLGDADSEVRAEALVGLGRPWKSTPSEAASKAGNRGRRRSRRQSDATDRTDATEKTDKLLAIDDEEIAAAIAPRLSDPSWTVVIAALRALTGPSAPISARPAVISRLRDAWSALRGSSEAQTQLHVLELGLDRLGAFALEADVRKLAATIAAESSADLEEADKETESSVRVVALSRVHCRAQALAVRGGAKLDLGGCGGAKVRGSALHLRQELLAEVAGEGLAGAFSTLEKLAGDADPRVRQAGMIATGTLASTTASVRADAEALLLRGLDDTSAAVAGAAAELLGTLAGAQETAAEFDRGAILGALAKAVGDGGEPEFDAAVLGAITMILGVADKRTTAGSEDGVASPLLTPSDRADLSARCRQALGGPAPVESAARACLVALGHPGDAGDAEDARESATDKPRSSRKLPFDPRSLLDAEVTWTLDTTQGVITIALDPRVAPWNVAALVGLTRQAYYSGVFLHRQVPGFVVQGGDPSGTGWGGPGFTSPGEASWRPFDRGAVGIADAGLDTGGSQFFIMHAAAPHLEGRYTWVGHVTEGLEIVDRLTTDDRILSAIVDVEPRSKYAASSEPGRGLRGDKGGGSDALR